MPQLLSDHHVLLEGTLLKPNLVRSGEAASVQVRRTTGAPPSKPRVVCQAVQPAHALRRVARMLTTG